MSITTRRKFLKSGSLAALVAAIPLKNVLAQKVKDAHLNPLIEDPPRAELAYYSKQTFENYLNSVFRLQFGSKTINTKLVKISDMPAVNGGECFALLFRGDISNLLQETFKVTHPALGSFDLLLVTSGNQSGKQNYMGTINRL